MLNPSNVDFCSEYYILEKAIEVVTKIGGADRQFRIEALHGPESVIPYSTRCYVRLNITAQATHLNTTGEPELKSETVSVWARYDLPETAADSADVAIEHALGLLRERSETRGNCA
jgi:hypothetical protein